MKQGDFTKVAQYYHNRPAYSTNLLEKLLCCVNENHKNLQALNVVEVGAGTGKMTQLLANFGMNIVAVEPNLNMRLEGQKAVKNSNVKWQEGSGERTGVEDNFADWAMMASSFHWTDPKKSLPEFSRILKPDGYFTAIWNPRNIEKGSLFDEIEQEIKAILPELNRVSSGTQNVKKWEDILVSTGDFRDCFFMECDYIEIMDKERYMGAWHSVNDIQAQAGEERWKKILSMIETKVSHLKIIEVPYKIRAWSVKNNKSRS
ncbi:class I SAM-dependent methyltransferase [Helicobacter anatolicus]|uniref:class I SAM-dependent methyltransferase n=1 Tax=Helicobacter anatolicus TaxID=2905874 RepID=UPI001E438139|nr:class I SAM-dependent methyltransferase [Helicobacter anatolicus]MCE3038673.1 class I SAM-dependent methyltransferase [Helicobacter anatolicus]